MLGRGRNKENIMLTQLTDGKQNLIISGIISGATGSG